MIRIRFLSALALFVATLCPAFAADAIFPPGIRVGLTPLVGLSVSKTFLGFETEDHSVKVLVAELPAAAYTEVANTFKAQAANNAPGPKPESIETAAGTGYYTAILGRLTAADLDAAVRTIAGSARSMGVDVEGT